MPSSDLFAFLEADLQRAQPPQRVASEEVDPVVRAVELANTEWSDQEAAVELARLFSRAHLRDGQARLLAALSRSPFAQPRGIRVARVLRAALQEAAESPP